MTPRTWHTSCTTVIRRPGAATTPAPATSSSHRWSRKARCSWERPTRWRCSACCISGQPLTPLEGAALVEGYRAPQTGGQRDLPGETVVERVAALPQHLDQYACHVGRDAHIK